MKKILIVVTSALMFLLNGCNKPDPIPGRIEGKTMNISEMKISEVKVWIKKDTTIMSTFSDLIGYYHFEYIIPGTYQIWASKEGYDTTIYMEVKVIDGSSTTRNIRMFLSEY